MLSPAVPVVADGYISPQVYEDMANATRAHGQKHLDALIKKAKQAGVRVKGLLLDGIPHERIAQAARSKKADLVVIGTPLDGPASPSCSSGASRAAVRPSHPVRC